MWLKANGHEDMCIAEVLLTWGPAYDYKIGYNNEGKWDDEVTKSGDYPWPLHIGLAKV